MKCCVRLNNSQCGIFAGLLEHFLLCTVFWGFTVFASQMVQQGTNLHSHTSMDQVETPVNPLIRISLMTFLLYDISQHTS